MSKLLYDTPPLTLLFDLLRSDAHISVNKALMFAIGVNEALIFCELLSRQAYFRERGQLTDDGYFFNTIADLQSGTSLTDRQQRPAITNLIKHGLVFSHLAGIPARRFFRINPDTIILVNLLNQGKNIAENARKATNDHSYDIMSKLDTTKCHTNKNNNNPDPLDHFSPAHEIPLLSIVGNAMKRKSRRN